MIALYQLLHKHFNINTSELFTATTITITRGHNLKLFKFPATTRVRSHFFSIRSINYWNNLPEYIINASSLSDFKKLLDSYCIDSMYSYI